jgi:hypothetical protein
VTKAELKEPSLVQRNLAQNVHLWDIAASPAGAVVATCTSYAGAATVAWTAEGTTGEPPMVPMSAVLRLATRSGGGG